MIYRICLTIGYRDANIDFDNCEEAADFATTLLEHYKQPKDEDKIIKVEIYIIKSGDDQEEE